ncbi:hypothetical protein [Tepidanaerobacter syntrophicus]|uniref:hypothetical protein n=1 Tax=Tepidanaerobacter syntrophicus TaxID=224999 RepID=UPI0024927853|nr:hypothetical protein [Tepidanaerobacter syntrophicus]
MIKNLTSSGLGASSQPGTWSCVLQKIHTLLPIACGEDGHSFFNMAAVSSKSAFLFSSALSEPKAPIFWMFWGLVFAFN